MSAKYDVMITNPPYIGISTMEPEVKKYATDNYPDSKTDMFAMFMEVPYVKKNGFRAMINMHSWMFLDSYVMLRKKIINNNILHSLIHLGIKAFEDIGNDVVQTCSFIFRNIAIFNFSSSFIRLVDVKDFYLKQISFFDNNLRFVNQISKFLNVPSYLFTPYNVNDAFFENFVKGKFLSSFATFTGSQNITGNNEKYLRCFWEVENNNIKENYWVFYAKGGNYRKYYGNLFLVVDWRPSAREFYKNNRTSNLLDSSLWYKEGITYSAVTSRGTGFRYLPKGCVFDKGGPSIILEKNIAETLSFLNSKIADYYFKIMNPSINLQVKDIKSVPFVFQINNQITKISQRNIEIAKADYDSNEYSFDFQLSIGDGFNQMSKYVKVIQEKKENDLKEIKQNEVTLNNFYKEQYHLNIPLIFEDRDFPVEVKNESTIVKELISQFVGIEMGRYSLDAKSLAYAGGEWDPRKYVTYQPDSDGIIPIYSQLGMEDGLTAKIIGLIKHVYGEDTYKENIDFIADALGKNNNESSEETLNRYLNDGFYPDHLKIYQKRPIYWMFSSGKNNAFKCLVYLHRYTDDTLAIINSKYFLNESARLNAEVEDTRLQLDAADGKDKLKLEKTYKTLQAKQKEMIEYGQVLDHMANQYIHLDLDDGVKVNYEKFQGIEIVNDNGITVKKDLLVPLK